MASLGEIPDERDGQINGRIPRNPDECPECGRPVSIKNNTCIYCDIKVDQKTPF